MGIIYNAPGGGSAVGHVESNGIIFSGGAGGGSAVGHVESSGIIFNAAGGGTAVGHIESSGIIFNAAGGGTAVGHIESSGIIFKGGAGGGTAIGHVDGDILIDGAGAALLLGLLGASNSSSNSSSSPSASDEKPGCFGVIFKFIAFCVRLFKTWSGRVGMLLGVIAGIAMASQAKDFMNALFIGIFAVLLLLFIGGALGTLVGFIFRKSSRTGKFGGLIGAGTLPLAGVILSLIERMRVNDIIMIACVGLAVGWVLGTIIGAIVGAIKKQIAKGKQGQ